MGLRLPCGHLKSTLVPQKTPSPYKHSSCRLFTKSADKVSQWQKSYQTRGPAPQRHQQWRPRQGAWQRARSRFQPSSSKCNAGAVLQEVGDRCEEFRPCSGGAQHTHTGLVSLLVRCPTLHNSYTCIELDGFILQAFFWPDEVERCPSGHDAHATGASDASCYDACSWDRPNKTDAIVCTNMSKNFCPITFSRTTVLRDLSSHRDFHAARIWKQKIDEEFDVAAVVF
jgi:hypothetical protein